MYYITTVYTVFYRLANLIEKAFEALIIYEYLIVWVQKNLLILCAFLNLMLNYKINKYKTQIINNVYLNILISFFKLLQSIVLSIIFIPVLQVILNTI